MNKKILIIVLGMCLLLCLIISIGAEENISNAEGNLFPQEVSVPEQINSEVTSDMQIDLTNDLSNISLDQPIEINDSNLPREINDSNENNESIVNSIISNTINSSNEEEHLPTNISPSQSEISSHESSKFGDNSEEDVYYISSTELDLNDTVLDENKTILENTGSIEQAEKGDICSLQSLGKKVIEIENCDEEVLGKFEVQELEKNELEKEVIISSKEHFNDSLTLYTSLTTEAKKEDIRVYWKNEENLEITNLENFSLEYYDENNNGLIDRISWSVPHLSEQIFKIVVNIENNSGPTDQLLLNVTAPIGQTRNPINFKINVSYSGDFSCNLDINNKPIWEDISAYKDDNLSLSNGSYNWSVICFDTSTGNTNASYGNFSINEGFSVNLTGGDFPSTNGRLYFLDSVKNDLKSNGTINIHSENPSKIRIELKRDNLPYYNQSIAGNITDYSLPLNKTILNQAGTYNLTVYFDEPSAKNNASIVFYVASANIGFNVTQIKEGESIKITTNVISPIDKITTISVYSGDVNIGVSQVDAFGNQTKYFTNKYPQDGIYLINLIGYIGTMKFEIQKNGINVTNPPVTGPTADTEAPSITLVEPNDEAEISDSIVSFVYKANDNVKVKNCSFKLYGDCASMNYCSTSSSNLIFPINTQQNSIANNNSVQNNKKIQIDLQEFENGIYEWLVECYDNSSNYDWEVRFFEINNESTTAKNTEDYSQKEEIESLKEQADKFLTENFDLEEKEVLEDLNILDDIAYYKKRLLDMQQFFEENYKYVSSEALREQKTNDYIDELEDITNKIPQSITIKESNEYTKNSVDKDFESIVQEYFDSTNTNVGKSTVQKLSKVNKELQNEISISAKVKNVEIEYNNGTIDITLVKKEINLKNNSYENILEIIPKGVAENAEEVTFLTKNSIINKDPIFEINYGDLDKKEIIYYFNKDISIKDIENTDTILFEDNLNKFEAGFTGFFVIGTSSGDITLYIILAFILLVILLFIVPFTFKKLKILNWRREPNVVRVMNLLDEADKLLREKEIEKAREKYYKIKEVYPLLPSKTKAYFYKRINEMLARIDRKDIFGLVKEYQEAKRKWNKEDFTRLYEDIKKIYERLPEKDRKKVYDIINGY